MSSNPEEYSPTLTRVVARAKDIGTKASNSIELEAFCAEKEQEFRDAGFHTKVKTPPTLIFDQNFIIKHLDTYAKEWRNLWDEFKKQQGKDSKSLNETALETLQKIRELILNVFKNYPIPNDDLIKYIQDSKIKAAQFFIDELRLKPKETKLMQSIRKRGEDDKEVCESEIQKFMIRSTAHEDSAKSSGAGIYKSFPCDANSLNSKIADVLVSYFEPDSFAIRLKTGDDITKDPLMAVFLQPMVRGKQATKNMDAVVTSGVMFTDGKTVCINSAFGHGEFVVESKGTVDTFFLTEENVVYPDIGIKDKRSVDALKIVDNPKELMSRPSLPKNVARDIGILGRMIEKHYGVPMDMEFIYDPTTNEINLVQARPIAYKIIAKLKDIISPPSSLSRDALREVRKLGLVEKGVTICPARKRAKVITTKEEVLICKDISTALKIYLSQPNSLIKAIIIENSTSDNLPINSHEAAEFNEMSIPVLQIKDATKIKASLNEPNLCLIVAPQDHLWLNWSSKIKPGTKREDIENELYTQGVLENGLFKSSLPARTSPIPIFDRPAFKPEPLDLATIGRSLTPEKVSSEIQEKIGDLIFQVNEAKSLEERNSILKKLLPALYKTFQKNELPTSLKSELPASSNRYQALLTDIESLESASPKTVDIAMQNLNNIIVRFTRMAMSKLGQEPNSPFQKLFQQAVITCAEIYKKLEKLKRYNENDSKLNSESDHLDKVQEELLDLISKLEGIISDPGNEKIITLSLMQIAREFKIRKQAEGIEGYHELKDASDKEFFQGFLKASLLMFNDADKQKWKSFTLFCCQNEKYRQMLARILIFNKQNKIDSSWMNTIFLQKLQSIIAREATKDKTAFNENKMNEIYKETLFDLFKESSKTVKELATLNLKEKKSMIGKWENRISEWSDPKNFEKLWPEYQKDITFLIESLSISENMSPLVKEATLKTVQDLTEIMDRTIKSLKGSNEYESKETQVRRFATLLDPYHTLMQKWAREIPDDQYEEWAKNISPLGLPVYNKKEKMLQAIENKYRELSTNTNADQLHASNNFSVAATKIGSTASFARQFLGVSLGTSTELKLTLEDLFSLMHQNILSSTNYFMQDVRIQVEQLPENLRKLIQAMLKVKYENTPMELLNISQSYPHIHFEFNCALGSHSSKFFIDYNQKTGLIEFENHFFGENRHDRMNDLAELVYLQGTLSGLPLTPSVPVYNELSQSLEYRFQFHEKMIPEKLDPIMEAISLNIHSLTSLQSRPLAQKFIHMYSRQYIISFIQETLKNGNIGSKMTNYIIRSLIEEIIATQSQAYQDHHKQYFPKNIIETYIPNIETLNITNSQDWHLIKNLIQIYGYTVNWNYRASPEMPTLFERILEFNTIEEIDELIKHYKINLTEHPRALEYYLKNKNMNVSGIQYFLNRGYKLKNDYLQTPQLINIVLDPKSSADFPVSVETLNKLLVPDALYKSNRFSLKLLETLNNKYHYQVNWGYSPEYVAVNKLPLTLFEKIILTDPPDDIVEFININKIDIEKHPAILNALFMNPKLKYETIQALYKYVGKLFLAPETYQTIVSVIKENDPKKLAAFLELFSPEKCSLVENESFDDTMQKILLKLFAYARKNPQEKHLVEDFILKLMNHNKIPAYIDHLGIMGNLKYYPRLRQEFLKQLRDVKSIADIRDIERGSHLHEIVKDVELLAIYRTLGVSIKDLSFGDLSSIVINLREKDYTPNSPQGELLKDVLDTYWKSSNNAQKEFMIKEFFSNIYKNYNHHYKKIIFTHMLEENFISYFSSPYQERYLDKIMKDPILKEVFLEKVQRELNQKESKLSIMIQTALTNATWDSSLKFLDQQPEMFELFKDSIQRAMLSITDNIDPFLSGLINIDFNSKLSVFVLESLLKKYPSSFEKMVSFALSTNQPYLLNILNTVKKSNALVVDENRIRDYILKQPSITVLDFFLKNYTEIINNMIPSIFQVLANVSLNDLDEKLNVDERYASLFSNAQLMLLKHPKFKFPDEQVYKSLNLGRADIEKEISFEAIKDNVDFLKTFIEKGAIDPNKFNIDELFNLTILNMYNLEHTFDFIKWITAHPAWTYNAENSLMLDTLLVIFKDNKTLTELINNLVNKGMEKERITLQIQEQAQEQPQAPVQDDAQVQDDHKSRIESFQESFAKPKTETASTNQSDSGLYVDYSSAPVKKAENVKKENVNANVPVSKNDPSKTS